MIRVALIEDDADIRDNLMLIIDRAEGFSCRQAFSDVQEAGKSLLNDPPDVLLMDITLPGKMNGIEGVEFLRAAGATFETIMLTVHQEEKLVFDALCAGACGYLTKNTPPNRILDALREAGSLGALLDSIDPALDAHGAARAKLEGFAAELHRLGILTTARAISLTN